MLDAEAAGVPPFPVAAAPEDGLRPFVVAFGVEAEVVGAELRRPVVAPAGQRPRLFADVVLGVGAAVGAEREQLHHLAAVVLVRGLLAVFVAVQPLQHRRVDRDRHEEVEERAEAGGPEEVRLVDHLLRGRDARVRGREPVVEDQAIRSTSGWLVRTIRSSHQRWSWPQASAGAIGVPSSSTGAGPVQRRRAARPVRTGPRRRGPARRAAPPGRGRRRTPRGRAGAPPGRGRRGPGRRRAGAGRC